MSFSKSKDFIFKVLSGFKGVPFTINGSVIRLDESLRRWKFDSELDMLKYIGKGLGPDDIFVDIGANFGLHTLYASTILKNGGQVYAFEPLPQNIALLEKHIRLNKRSNVTIFKGAVSNSDKEYLEFYFPEEDFLQTGALKPHTGASNKIQVKNHRLDDLADQWNKPVKLIKIDVEGAEMDVLKSAKNILSKWHPDLLIEIHGFALPNFGYTSDQLLKFLTDLGYTEERYQIGKSQDNYFQSFFYFKP
jgi:FkbM family methyltransferase